jgi:hypothetical protein
MGSLSDRRRLLMLSAMILLTSLATPEQPSAGQTPSYTPEEAAVGTIRSIISAQAAYAHTHPDAGYACDVETLVKADMLAGALSAGKTFDGYVFRVWCETRSTPQASFRASAVPAKKDKGSSLTVCTDETNVPRTTDGDVTGCFAKGASPQ